MSLKIVRDTEGREAWRVVTPSGVVGLIATEVPPEQLKAMAEKLRRRLVRSGHLPKGRQLK